MKAIFAVLQMGCACLWADTQAGEHETAGDVRVMTWNILHQGWEKEGQPSWKERAPNVVRVLREQKPDVVGLQEDGRNQVAYITNALHGYSYIQPHVRKGGGLLIRTEAWEVIESGKIPIPGKRHASWALLKSTRNGACWLFYNAHLIHRTAPESAAARMEGAKSISQHMVRHAPAGVPVVFTGDFNALPDMPVMRYLAGDAGSPMAFSNTFDLLHGVDDPLGTWRGLGKEHHVDRIDHILINERVSVHHAEIIFYDDLSGAYPSDHYPLQVTLSAGPEHRFQEEPDKGPEAKRETPETEKSR